MITIVTPYGSAIVFGAGCELLIVQTDSAAWQVQIQYLTKVLLVKGTTTFLDANGVFAGIVAAILAGTAVYVV